MHGAIAEAGIQSAEVQLNSEHSSFYRLNDERYNKGAAVFQIDGFQFSGSTFRTGFPPSRE
jgi:hypothetical protein